MHFRKNQNKAFIATSIIVATFLISLIGFRVIHALMDPHGSSTLSTSTTAQGKDRTESHSDKATIAETMKEQEKKKAAEAEAKAAAEQASEAAVKQTPVTSVQPVNTASPRGKKLFVDAAAKVGQPGEIASQPTAVWLGGWSGDVRQTAHAIVSNAARQGTVATLVLYNIPNRDCGSYSAGGASGSQAYRSWIRAVAAGIGPREAIVIIEPDALAQISSCLSASDQATRYADLSDAVSVFATQTKAFTYLDAGNSNWIDASTMADRLAKANVAQARGFALNVSAFQSTPASTQYGNAISSKIGKSFVIDTSRNGQGPNGGEWCNPRGRGLGKKPTTVVSGNVDAYLWVKVPGESDGECNNGPSAGTWWDEYAHELIRNAVY